MKSIDELEVINNLIICEAGTDGGCGELYLGKVVGSVVWSNGGGWEHVSFAPYNRRVLPSWHDMCRIKDMFFYEEETVVQYHPAKSEYVNNVPNCLHLWRPLEIELPKPPSFFVGLKQNETLSELTSKMQELLN